MRFALLACLVACSSDPAPTVRPERSAPDPALAIASFQRAVEAGDRDAIWSFVGSRTVARMTTGKGVDALRSVPDQALADVAAAAGKTPAQLRAKSTPELAKTVMFAEIQRDRDDIIGSTVRKIERAGDTAVITLATPAGEEEKLVLVLEDGAWKIDGAATERITPPPR